MLWSKQNNNELVKTIDDKLTTFFVTYVILLLMLWSKQNNNELVKTIDDKLTTF